jgi:hypothetical protein
MQTFKLLICRFPGQYQEHPASSTWVSQVFARCKCDAEHLRLSHVESIWISDTPITMTRNRAAQIARNEGYDYLLMIDSDIAPDIYKSDFFGEAWKFMMRRRELEAKVVNGIPPRPATIGAPYCGPPPHENCYVFHWATTESDSPNPNYRLEMIPREHAAIRSGIEEVAALPTGLILYDVRVFEELPPPWFAYEWTDKYQTAKATTEDVYQTRNASLLGMPQFVAWDCWAGHVKSKTVGKPCIIGRDQVHESLRDAVIRGLDSDHRLLFSGAENHTESIVKTARFKPPVDKEDF